MDLSKVKETIAIKLTPKDTEEVKPNLFIQSYGNNKFRHIYPAAWNKKLIYKNLILGGDQWLKHLITFLILMFIVWAYVHDNAALIEQQQEIANDPFKFCQNIIEFELSKLNQNHTIDFNIYGETNTLSLSNLSS
jgi:hypothetical protein